MVKKMKVIINADDFGMNEGITKAIIECFKKGYISNTTIMPNMPYSEKAVELAKEEGIFNKIGLHLNLREGKPLTEKIRKERIFCDENGYFKMNIPYLKRYYSTYKSLPKCAKIALTEEIEAQMKWYVDKGFTQMHLDSHQSIHTWKIIFSAVIPLFNKYGFKSMRKRIISENSSLPQRIYAKNLNKKILSPVDIFIEDSYFDKTFEKLDKNKTYEVMCHPKYEDGKIIDFVSKIEIAQIVKDKKIELISY